MKVVAPLLSNQFVTLEPVNAHTVDLLVQWTLDPMAQGPYKRVPTLTADELRVLFLHGPDRHHFLIRRTADGQPLGRFYYRAWRFGGETGGVDWQLNIFLAGPCERGKDYGTAAQQLVVDYLLARHDTRSVCAYAAVINTAERRALEKAGFEALGLLPHPHYRVEPPPQLYILYTRVKSP